MFVCYCYQCGRLLPGVLPVPGVHWLHRKCVLAAADQVPVNLPGECKIFSLRRPDMQPEAQLVDVRRYQGGLTLYTSVHCSLTESPECWNLEFQQVEIFADNFLIIANNLYIFAKFSYICKPIFQKCWYSFFLHCRFALKHAAYYKGKIHFMFTNLCKTFHCAKYLNIPLFLLYWYIVQYSFIPITLKRG